MLEKIYIYPYRRAGRENKKTRPSVPKKGSEKKFSFAIKDKVAQLLTAQVFFLSLTGFFLGRALLLGELVPFGAAFVAAAGQVYGRAGLFAAAPVLLGLATILKGIPLAGAAMVVSCTWLILKAVPAGVKKPPPAVPGLVMALTVIIKSSLLTFSGPSPYGYFSVLFEGVFAAILTFVFTNGLAVWQKAVRKEVLKGDELFYLLLFLGCFIAGTGDLQYSLVSIKGVLSRLVILTAAFMGGTGTGAAAGAVAGIIPGLSFSTMPALVGSYSFAGLLAGLFRHFGKAGVITGFFLGNIILSVYLVGNGNLTAVLAETGLAVLVFLAVPPVLINDLKVTLGIAGREPEKEKEQAEARYIEFFSERIHGWARILQELSRTFEQVSSAAGQNAEERVFRGLFNKIEEKVCPGCSFCRTCWDKEFYRTYQRVLDLFTHVEIYGTIAQESFSGDFKRRCARTRELAIAINCLYETYSNSRYWSRRLLESREIVAEQLRGIAGVIEKLPLELEYDGGAAAGAITLRRRLKNEGVPLEHLSVSCREEGGMEIFLTRTPCDSGLDCSELASRLTRLTEQSYHPAASTCTLRKGEHACRLRFYPSLPYFLDLGAADAGKNGSLVTGDSYSFFYLKGGRLGLVLSDGMGAGPRAALESGTTISLLQYLLESGFSHELAIKTVNSMLLLRSREESFATVDLAVIDLYSGQAEFLKICAQPTFLLRGGRVTPLYAGSLPVGIVEEVEAACLTRALLDGDVLVMVSDGVLDAGRGAADKEEWLAGILHRVAGLPPQEMAELILKLAQTGAGGASRVPDDMAVLTARISKREPAAQQDP